jgi:succinate dehydrogenase / fumarate reductase membrane anchor subunit
MSRKASGLRAWILQRLTAVYMALFVIYLALLWLPSPPDSHAVWRAWVANPWVSIAILLFFLSLLLHAWIGIRDVLIDYVRPIGARLTLLALTGLGLLGCGLWVLELILMAGAGS